MSSSTPELISDPVKAVDVLIKLYNQQIETLRAAFKTFCASPHNVKKAHGFYPKISLRLNEEQIKVSKGSFGFCDRAGVYETTITRPELFQWYILRQLRALKDNHECEFEISLSDEVIPIHFAFPDGIHLEGQMDADTQSLFFKIFDSPDLKNTDDAIANSELYWEKQTKLPLALFKAQRIDYSLHRLQHYTGTGPGKFQKFILFTNYQFYIDAFIELGKKLVADPSNDYVSFTGPDENARMPQMPAYHLGREHGEGITLVNIGVGPSNAKTITDHIAVLRPTAWIMLGHCAGLRHTQKLGDFVLAHGYVRDDHVLDADLPLWIPIPPLAEVQQALENAVAEICTDKNLSGEGQDVKSIMRTGTVASIDNRNWELRDQREPLQRFSQSRAIGLDMESATIAANGFRFRVPYGTLLIVSDRPLHGELKLPGMASSFYTSQVENHLNVGICAIEILRGMPSERLHSRKLRSFDEVPFR